MQHYMQERAKEIWIENTLQRLFCFGIILLIFYLFRKFWDFDQWKSTKDYELGKESNAFKALVFGIFVFFMDLSFMNTGLQIVAFFFCLYQISQFFVAKLKEKNFVTKPYQGNSILSLLMALPLGFLGYLMGSSLVHGLDDKFLPDFLMIFCTTVGFPVLSLIFIKIAFEKRNSLLNPEEMNPWLNQLLGGAIILASVTAAWFLSSSLIYLHWVVAVIRLILYLFSRAF